MTGITPPRLAALARSLYDERRRRTEYFPQPGLFGEPAWDILLDLFSAAHDGRIVSVSSACIGAAVPPTTALRWLRHMENVGMADRLPDRHDKRRANLRMTPAAHDALAAYLRDQLEG